MAYFSFNTGSGGGPSPVPPIEPYEGKLGLTVSQWLSSPASEEFGSNMEEWLELGWEDVLKRWFNKEAPFETLYDDVLQLEADIMAWYWSRRPSWDRIKASLEAQYNPIENYDRTRTGTESDVQGTVNTATSGSDNSSNGSEEKDAPYDSGTYLNKVQMSGNMNSSYNSNVGQTTNMKTTTNIRDHGNVGVTTNQQMITQELILRASYLVGIVIGEFKKEFCVALYN